MVRSIGADRVVDYTQEDFTRDEQRYDLILDAVGNRSASDYARALKPGGICVVAGFTTMGHMLQMMLRGGLMSMTGDKTITVLTAEANQPDLVALAGMLEAGKVVPVIDRRYPLSEAAEAIRYLEEGRARGKVIITVAENGS